MSRHPLIENRPWLLASIAAAIAFFTLPVTLQGGVYAMAIKGLAVGLLVPYALQRKRTTDGLLLALVMALGAAGDVAMELDTVIGGALFFAGHLFAIALYWRNCRIGPTGSQRGAALALLVMTPLVSWMLALDPGVAVYAFALGGMAATAWLSRFSRYRVGIGAVLFVVSDWLIFARLGGVLPETVTGWLIWPIYYTGQLMICTGVIRGLRRDHAA
ncbi:lysoplasmalogenase [Tsuneonella mangrovi]|uniref:lysoplasmalogenase n=1 Tax=Tsuneonella mangrovi TaxID=1982042 RepID=UPI000BA26B05|nr:lysoplasmalogenase [Tsuneonella mangrovi]